MGGGARWVRFEHSGREGFGRLDGEQVEVHRGSLFDGPQPTGEPLPASAARPLTPCRPGLTRRRTRQDDPAADMHFPVDELVSRVSHDMMREPGDLILRRTSLGVGSMKTGSRVTIRIDAISSPNNPVV